MGMGMGIRITWLLWTLAICESVWATAASEIDVSKLASSVSVNKYHQNEYYFADGDAGWSAAFRQIKATGLKTIHFPGGVYHLTRPAKIDLFALFGDEDFYQNGVVVYGDGIENTYFNGDQRLAGSAIEIGSSKAKILMGFKIHGFSLRVDSTEYALRLNPDPGNGSVAVDWNGCSLNDVYVHNAGVGLGAIYVRRWFSGRIQTTLAVVNSAQRARYNDVAAVLLDEVQYTLLDLRGLGSGTVGWGLILQNYCYSNHFMMVHVEGAGGAMLFKGAGVGANEFIQVLVSQVLNVQPPDSGLESHNLIDSSNHPLLPVGHAYRKVFVNTMYQKFDSRWPLLGTSAVDFLCIDFSCTNGTSLRPKPTSLLAISSQ